MKNFVNFRLTLQLIVMLCFIIIGVIGNVSVKVKGSTFIGKQLNTVFDNKAFAVFWKIPYAEPPLRELRFKTPKKRKHHSGTFDYSQLPRDTCICYNEDRLYLSVFMPMMNNLTRNLPVIVWINDKFSSYNTPDFLLEEDVIVVTVNYRSSIFGFLNTGDEFSEGNMGAKDVITALRWINDYICSFDGDPDTVTVAGHKNAATLVASLILTPVADGLFKRIIVLSGSALSPADYRNYNFDIMNKLYWKLNGPYEKLNRTNLYKMLSNYSTCELIEVSRDIFDSTEVRDNQRLITAFGPSIESCENAFMNKFPIDVYKSGLANGNVEVMMGYTSLESVYKLQGFAKDKKLLECINYNFQYLLPFEGAKDEYESKRYRKIKDKIMDFYFINGTIGERSLRRYAKYVSDQVIYPLLRQARFQAEVSCTNVYLYRFSFKGSLNVGWDSSVQNLNWSGATAGDEICYLFRCKSENDVYKSIAASNEKLFIKKFAKLLTNFAKYGNPTPDPEDGNLKDLFWEPLVSGGSIRVMNLNRKLRMIDAPEQRRAKFWDDLKREFFPEKLNKGEL